MIASVKKCVFVLLGAFTVQRAHFGSGLGVADIFDCSYFFLVGVNSLYFQGLTLMNLELIPVKLAS
jgi:hypothetical protein